MTTNDDTTKSTPTLQEKPAHRRQFDIYAAPDCETDILSETPRVTLGPNGKPHLALMPLKYDGDVGEEVEQVTILPLANTVYVRTRTMGVFMKSSDYDAQIPKRTREQIDREDIHDAADSLIGGVLAGFNPTETAEFLWSVGRELMMHPDRYGREQALGYAMCLDALIAAPDAVMDALRALREELRLSDLEIDVLK